MDRFQDTGYYDEGLEDYIEIHYDDVYDDLIADKFSPSEAHTLALEVLGDMFREREGK